ncbi:MAG TPA: efflux RND transporter periplasmic adaptor subunit [Blastocatellia bacterium]|nr:efflux RND transporter periplasmic adaptor subunit [Blastocatellia bacterium]
MRNVVNAACLIRRIFALRLLAALSVAALTALIVGCSKDPPKPPPAPAPVTVSTVVEKDMPVELHAIGNVQPYSTVPVKSQINGEIFTVNFKEGQDVKSGDLLFVLDPRPFEAALKQAEANMARDSALEKQYRANLVRDQAQAKYAEAESNRYANLIEEGVVTKEVFEDKRSASDALNATVKADQAAIENSVAAMGADKASIENAKVQLGYCYIKAPMNGTLGGQIAYKGTMVKANDTTSLVTINQIMPTYVSFSVPQENLPAIRKYMADGELKVEAILQPSTALPGKDSERRLGKLSFFDNTVDQATGTILLKATFANADKVLWPGQFVNVVLTLTSRPNAIVAPARAVQIGQQGQFVYVVKPDMTVESRPVVLGKGTDTEAVIDRGLSAGERVVTDGQLRLVPGAKVEITGPVNQLSKENGQ